MSGGRTRPWEGQRRVDFKGTRIPVAAVFENLENGVTIDELLDLYEGLTRVEVKAVLDFAAHSLQTRLHSR